MLEPAVQRGSGSPEPLLASRRTGRRNPAGMRSGSSWAQPAPACPGMDMAGWPGPHSQAARALGEAWPRQQPLCEGDLLVLRFLLGLSQILPCPPPGPQARSRPGIPWAPAFLPVLSSALFLVFAPGEDYHTSLHWEVAPQPQRRVGVGRALDLTLSSWFQTLGAKAAAGGSGVGTRGQM